MLEKKSDHLKVWNKRRFEYSGTDGFLNWYEVDAGDKATPPLGRIMVDEIFEVPTRPGRRTNSFGGCG